MMMLVVMARYGLAPTSMLMLMWLSSSPYAFKKILVIFGTFPQSAWFRLTSERSLDISLSYSALQGSSVFPLVVTASS